MFVPARALRLLSAMCVMVVIRPHDEAGVMFYLHDVGLGDEDVGNS